jgi:hypothetical protein
MPDEKPVAVFVCTDADMAPYVLPRDTSLGRVPTAEEMPHVHAIADAVRALKALGWREAIYAPRDMTPIWLIEAGSIGVHEGYRDEGGFWICDGDSWPSRPVLWMPKVAADAE